MSLPLILSPTSTDKVNGDIANQSAASKVFNTVELLESILLELPCKDIVLAQRVSKIWQGTVTGSLELQKALYFVPSQLPAIRLLPDGAPPATTLKRFRRKWEISLPPDELTARDISGSIAKGQVTLNPLFTSLFSKTGDEYRFVYNRTNAVADIGDSSWKNMYLTQPPCIEIMLHSQRSLPPHCQCEPIRHVSGRIWMSLKAYTNTLSYGSGVTIGDFVEHLETTFERSAGNSCRFNIYAL